MENDPGSTKESESSGNITTIRSGLLKIFCRPTYRHKPLQKHDKLATGGGNKRTNNELERSDGQRQ